jgi:hypothetical protein
MSAAPTIAASADNTSCSTNSVWGADSSCSTVAYGWCYAWLRGTRPAVLSAAELRTTRIDPLTSLVWYGGGQPSICIECAGSNKHITGSCDTSY